MLNALFVRSYVEEVAGGWTRLQYEELRNLYTSLNIIRVIVGVAWER
jgi:hypothetical protein